IKIKSLEIDQPVFTQYDYTGFRPRDTTSAPEVKKDEVQDGLQWNPDNWNLVVQSIRITGGMFATERQSSRPAFTDHFDDKNIVLTNIDAEIGNLQLIQDTLKANILLSAREPKGFLIKKLASDFKFTPQLMEFKKLDLVTNKSHLRDYYAMHFHHFSDDMNDFVHSINVEGHFKNSELSSDDLAFFAPETGTWNKTFSLDGTAKGTIDNLTARNMNIHAGKNNYLKGDISMRGLPDLDILFIDFRGEEVRTTYSDLVEFIPALKSIDNPRLSAFGNISFSGSYTGYLRDFVTYGTLKTDIGTLKTDLHLVVPSIGKPVYNGTLSTTNFLLGKFINNSEIGAVAFSGSVHGKGFDQDDIDVGIDGTIDRVEFNNYSYSNIVAHGRFLNKLFTGTASINDPNISIDTLAGSINFSKSMPSFNVDAFVSRLNLKQLGVTQDSVSLTGRFNLNFAGNNIDNFLGSAKIYDASLFDNGQQLSFDSLTINSFFQNERKILTLQTNEMDASISGTFNILELPDAFQLFLYKYYPAYINKPKLNIPNQDFTFLVKTRSISDYVSLFEPKIKGLDNSIIIGNINVKANTLNLQADVPSFSYSNINFTNIHFTGIGTVDTLKFKGEIDDVVINDSLHSEGTTIGVVVANDISDVNILTSANKTLNSADLSFRIFTNTNGFRLVVNPSTFTINQKKWRLDKGGELELIRDMVIANNVRLSEDGQEILVSTEPSAIGSSNDVIINLKKLNINDITPLFTKDVTIEGLMTGVIRINDPFNRPHIEFDTKTELFRFQNDSIGLLHTTGDYLVNRGDITLKAISDNEPYNFSANFNYRPEDTTANQLTGSLVLNHSGIHILQQYLDVIFSDIHGRATGMISLSGTAAEPKLAGSVKLDAATMTVAYTRCRYIFADNSIITFRPDEIDLGTLKVRDTLNNSATVTGKLYHNFFNNFFFNELHFKTDPRGNRPGRFVLLNTTQRDNNEFYGNVIGDAELSLNGFETDMRMAIKGEPTDSSHIYLPTGETADTRTLDYIEFIKFGREMSSDSSSRHGSSLKVDMELTANPFAKIDVILDETTGDVIQAQGSGKLYISAGTKDPLTIRGRYDVQDGQYTFNFQTFLKTPFNLESGFIEWQGDPYLANLNIDAVYTAQNVLLNNIPTVTGFSNTRGNVDIIFKLRGTLKDPRPEFEFQFPFDNPLKSDPIASEYLKTRYEADVNELNKQVTSLLLFNTFMSNDQRLLSGTNTGNFVTRSVGQLLSATLSSSLNTWLQKLLNTNSVNLYTNINTADFNFGVTPKELQNVGNFGVRTTFFNNKLLVKVGGNVDYRLGQTPSNSNSNFLFTPDVSFEYLISPDGRFRVIGFNRSDADLGDISGVTRRNRTGLQLSYRKEFDSFEEFFINDRKQRKLYTEK
ncbi:MAG: translocation/assembly module TamB domain-containing protein, partial [Ginsengibacter sp.]